MSKKNQIADLEAKRDAAVKEQEEKEAALKNAQELSVPLRRERAFHITESQQIRNNIEILKNKKKELQLQIKLAQHEAEEIERKNFTDIQVHKQKVKHLLHTHANDLHRIDKEHETVKKTQENDQEAAMKLAEGNASHLMDDFMNNQFNHNGLVIQQKEDTKSTIQKAKEDYDKRFKEIEEEQEANMESLYEDYNLQRINELHEIQERKDHHINKLIKSHKKSFQDMRNFYNKITQDHLSYISQYDEELKAIQARLKDYEKRKKDYDREILDLTKQEKAQRDKNGELHKKLSTYEADKMALANSRNMIQSLTMEIDSLKHQHSVKEAKFKKMAQEKEQLQEKFEASVHDVKQKTEFRALLLLKKVETLGEVLKKKEGNLEEMIETSDIPPEEVQELSEEVADLLRAKNQVIDNLEYELAKATKAHNDLITVYRAKMSAAGVPEDELDFELRPSNTTSAPAPALFH